MVRPRQKVIRWAQMSYEQKSKPAEENKKIANLSKNYCRRIEVIKKKLN